MNGSLRTSSMTRKSVVKTAATTARSRIIGLPNQSFRWPSSSTTSSEPRPSAMQAMPSQSPCFRRSRRIGPGSMPHQTAATSMMPGTRLM